MIVFNLLFKTLFALLKQLRYDIKSFRVWLHLYMNSNLKVKSDQYEQILVSPKKLSFIRAAL